MRKKMGNSHATASAAEEDEAEDEAEALELDDATGLSSSSSLSEERGSTSMLRHPSTDSCESDARETNYTH